MSTRREIGSVVSIIVRTIAIIGLLAIAIGIASWLTMTRPIPPSSERANELRTVEVIRVNPEEVARTWVGYGIAQAVNTVDVPCEVSSIVQSIPDGIEVGAEVEAGQLLAQIDDHDYRQQTEIAKHTLSELQTRVQQLEVDLRSANERVELAEREVAILQSELTRVRDAHAEGAAAQREVDMVRQRVIQSEMSQSAARERRDSIPIARALLETQLAAQQTTREIAMRNVERCHITSPIKGVIESFDIEVGERVDPLRRIGRIVDPWRLEVPVRLPSSARMSVRVGDLVALQAEGAVTRNWVGSVQRISPVDDQTRTMRVYVDPYGGLLEDPPLLAPGTFLAASVTSLSTTARIVVPRDAVQNKRVWFVDEAGQIDSTLVEIAFAVESLDGAERRLVLESGLPDGTLVVVNANRAPAPGTTVNTNILKPDTTP